MFNYKDATSNRISSPDRESGSSSLTLSISPPQEESSTISEHLTSIENDRSMQEIEVPHLADKFEFLLKNVPDERISQETLNSSFNSSSIISLNGLERFICTNTESKNNARSILDEILSNDQFNSEQEESLDIFANIDLDERLLNSYNGGKSANFNLKISDNSLEDSDEMRKRLKECEEMNAVKTATIVALTSELDSFRELLSNTSTNSLGTSTTEYKQYEECHNKLVEYQNAIDHKQDQIDKLTISLQQSIKSREDMKQHLQNEVEQLRVQLKSTSESLKEEKVVEKSSSVFEESCSNLEKLLNDAQLNVFEEVKSAVTAQMKSLAKEYEESVIQKKLGDLKEELNRKHSKEMEELRTYFEQKCADLEKNYSEEVFSQQSRKMSGSSSCSEISADFAFGVAGPGGDSKVDFTKKDVSKMRHVLSQVMSILNNYDVENLSDEDLKKLTTEVSKCELQSVLKHDLVVIKNELQNKYHAELEILREDFDNRIDSNNIEHESKLRELEKRYMEEIQDLNTQLRGRISTTVQEVRLATSDNIDEDWPDELLQLKSKFGEKYENDIASLKREYEAEIDGLKEEHGRALERARRRSLRDADSLSKGEIELLKERDLLKKQTSSLKNLIGELLKYFTQCEDELNSTLVEELLNKNVAQMEDEQNKRVHITPNFNDLINLIDNSPESDLDSIDLKGELGVCLKKLKSDANAILTLTSNLTGDHIEERQKPQKHGLLERQLSSLTRKLINETQIRNDLSDQLNESKSVVQSLENDRMALENQLEEVLAQQKVLEYDLRNAKQKISELIENGHKEIISEGYGEDGNRTVHNLGEAINMFRLLQEKTRTLTENRGDSLDIHIINLMEKLARTGDKIIEEAGRDNDDLKMQIEAADKKYKLTCQFLEDQATEREQERDEAQKEIDKLKENLKERDKDKANYERYAKEVEILEQQLREFVKLLEEKERNCKEIENERQEAIDKIYELRDIIRELEDQICTKTTNEKELRTIVGELEVILKKQITHHNTQAQAQDIADISQIEQLQLFEQYVKNLEDEVQKLRLTTEIAGSEGALQQIKNHLFEFETTIDKRTKDLETLHSTVSSCSSPSEDMSIRDVVNDRSVDVECEIPLQQLSRLKEKLLRHSRAEDAAVKRIRDLEMQLDKMKPELQDAQNEKTILTKQISDHLALISNLQIRLDEQRIRAEHIEKQTKSSLEIQNYETKNTIITLKELVAKKEKVIAQLNVNLEETKKRLEDCEKEILQNKTDDLVIQMQEQLEFLRLENMKLKTKMDKEAHVLPNLVENIITDKNNEIEMLRDRLTEATNELQFYTSLNLNKSEIETVSKLKLSGITLDDFEQIRSQKVRQDSLIMSPNLTEKSTNLIKVIQNEPEISSIEKTGHANLFYSLQIPQNKANSTEKHVRFEDEVSDTCINELKRKLLEYENRIQTLNDLEKKVAELENILQQTETALTQAGVAFEIEQEKKLQQISALKRELAEKTRLLEEQKININEINTKLLEKQKLIDNKEFELKSERLAVESVKHSIGIKNEELKSHKESQSQQLQKVKDLEITIENKEITLLKTQKELEQLRQLLQEKDKIIEQMEADSKSLHTNLESIQAKLTETGNVIDLGRRLREEQLKNSALYEELHGLKAQLLSKKSLDNIADEVQRELNYSLHLDNSILSAIGDGSLESFDPESLKLTIRKYKSVNKQLVKAKDHTENKYHDLELEYNKLRQEMETLQREDSVLINQLSSRLDSAIANELQFNKILEKEKQNRNELEDQMQTMKYKLSSVNSKAESLPDFHNEKVSLLKKIALLEQENMALTENTMTMRSVIKKINNELESKSQELLQISSLSTTEREKLTNEKMLILRQMEQMKTAKGASENIPDKVMEKIKELNNMVKDNLSMVDLIARLTHEKTVLEDRINILEEHRLHIPFNDPISRANYLFAKFLRSESYRKALVWQKQYLISLLKTYQSTDIYEKFSIPRTKRKRPTFKSAAIMVVAVYRMRYLVRRWHSGKRIIKAAEKPNENPHFQVGHPVSSQNFSTNTKNEPKSALNHSSRSDMPWFGTSPPSKETYPLFQSQSKQSKMTPRKVDISIPQNQGAITQQQTTKVQDSLTSPALLSKYIDRFNQIQEKLGLEEFQ